MGSSEFEDLVQSLGPTAILDMGCGCGRFTRRLAQAGVRAIGVDTVSHASWPQVRAESGVLFCRMNALALAFDPDAFPCVVERAALHHIENWREALAAYSGPS